MKTIITGATGLVGTALVSKLLAEGHSVTRLVRRNSKRAPVQGITDVVWNPDEGIIDRHALEGHDAVVHLAGENVAERWTVEKKRRILESRAKGTGLLSVSLAQLSLKPSVLVSASAIGYYGANRGNELLTEESDAGADFLSDVCRAWEAALVPAEASGIRVVRLRIGVVLSTKGGALAKMLPPFKLGVGGKIGNGEQFMSWIAIDDVVSIIQHALTEPSLSGPVNTVGPNPAKNVEFTKTLAKVLGRPAIFPMPAFAVKLLFGEMGEALLLSSTRAQPARLQKSDFRFTYPQLEGALRHLLNK